MVTEKDCVSNIRFKHLTKLLDADQTNFESTEIAAMAIKLVSQANHLGLCFGNKNCKFYSGLSEKIRKVVTRANGILEVLLLCLIFFCYKKSFKLIVNALLHMDASIQKSRLYFVHNQCRLMHDVFSQDDNV